MFDCTSMESLGFGHKYANFTDRISYVGTSVGLKYQLTHHSLIGDLISCWGGHVGLKVLFLCHCCVDRATVSKAELGKHLPNVTSVE